MSASATKPYRLETRLVHSGTLRSQFGETSEALFLTQGYVYENAAQAERRFKGEEPGYQYSRFSNPTVAMFEERMCALEGARGRARHRDRHGGGQHRTDGAAAGRRPRRGRQGAVRLLPLRGRGPAAALRRRLDAGRRHRPRAMAQGGAAEHQGLLPRKPDQPDARGDRHRGGRRRSPTRRARRWWSTTCSPRRCWQSPLELGADCVVYSATKHIDGQGRCLGGVILASEEFIQSTSTHCCARPARRSRRSTPGCCSRGWRRCRCGCSGRPTLRRRIADGARRASQGDAR